jgi:hypothetical protein
VHDPRQRVVSNHSLLKRRPTAPRLALTREEAADALGVSVDHFDEHIRPHLRVIYSGRKRLWSVKELERWLDENATAVR